MHPLTELHIALTDFLRPIVAQCLKEALDSMPKPAPVVQNSTSDEWLLPVEAANYIKMPLSSFRTKLANRDFPSTKTGRRVLIRRSDLDVWLESGRRKTSDEITADSDLYLKKKARETARKNYLKNYITPQEAADFLGISLQTLYQHIDRVPSHKRYGKLCFWKPELELCRDSIRPAFITPSKQ